MRWTAQEPNSQQGRLSSNAVQCCGAHITCDRQFGVSICTQSQTPAWTGDFLVCSLLARHEAARDLMEGAAWLIVFRVRWI